MNKTGHSMKSLDLLQCRGQRIGSIGSKLTCLALGTLLLTGSVQAAFDDVWWTEAGPGWTNATDRPVVSNLVTRQITEVWTQTSNTNYIPEVFFSIDFPYINSWWLWRNSWEDVTEILYPNSHVLGFWGNTIYSPLSVHYFPIGEYTNAGSRTWTNTFIEYPRPDVSSTRVGYYGNAAYMLYNENADYLDYTEVWSNDIGTIYVTNNVVLSTAATTNDGLYASVYDAVAIDAYYALAERWAITQGDHDEDRTTINDDYKPVMGRQGKTRNLDRTKNFLSSLIPSFVNPYITNDFTTLFGTPYSNVVGWSIFSLTESNLLMNFPQVPTNYFDYTPPQLYSLYPVVDYGRIVTNSHVMVCTGTNTCTNSIIDFEGDARAVTGTNGQIVTVLSTNENILAGYTLSDYGWKHMPTLITNGLRWIGGDYAPTPTHDGGTDRDYPWATAKAGAEVGPALGTPYGNWTTGTAYTNQYGVIDEYEARWYSSAHMVSATCATNIEADVDIYVYADIDGAYPYTTGSNYWDDSQFPALIQDRMTLVTNALTSNSVVSFVFSTTNIGTWCTEPLTEGISGRTWRGYSMNYGKRRALYRYDSYLDNK